MKKQVESRQKKKSEKKSIDSKAGSKKNTSTLNSPAASNTKKDQKPSLKQDVDDGLK